MRMQGVQDCKKYLKNAGETVEAPSGLEPEPQV